MIRTVVAIATFFVILITQTAVAAGLILIAIALAATFATLLCETFAHHRHTRAIGGDDR